MNLFDAFCHFWTVLNLVDPNTYVRQKNMLILNQALLCEVIRKTITRLSIFGNCEFQYPCYIISKGGILCLICGGGECGLTCWLHDQCKTFKYFKGHM